MGTDDLGTEGDHLDSRELAADHCAFEPAVHDVESAPFRTDARRSPSRYPGDESRGQPPRRIRLQDLDFRTGQPRRRLDPGDDARERGGVGAPRHRGESEHAVLGFGDVQARARLDRARESWAHRDDPARDCRQKVERASRRRLVRNRGRVCGSDRHRKCVVRAGELLANRTDLMFYGLACGRFHFARK